MLLELNKFEKRVGFFLLFVFAGLVVSLAYIAYEKKWFAPKVEYFATYERGDGLHSGTQINVAGINAGKVTDVELNEDNKIRVRMQVLRKFYDKIKTDSVAKIIRPFVIGDKVIDISIGSKDKSPIAYGAEIPSQESMELIDLVSGGNMAPYLETLSNALDKLKNVLDILLESGDEKQVVDLVNEILPTIRSIRQLSDALGGNDMKSFLSEGSGVMKGMNRADTYKVLTDVDKAAKELVALNKRLEKVDIEKLVKDLSSLVVVLNGVSGKIPEITTKGIKVLDEGIWVLKGMQKSWFLKSHIENMQKEEQKAAGSKGKKK
ncbi:MAG: MCE family protein [Oligoflexia bacterium]|nr:MCE family protein [Oligoflexia bacterium]